MTRIAIERNRVTITALLVVAMMGVSSFFSLPRSEDPGFIVRTALVMTYFPGASPDRVEQLVTDKLEKAIQEMPELDFVSSTSKTGTSVIYVNVQERYREMRPIWDSLRRKVDRARGELPEGIVGVGTAIFVEIVGLHVGDPSINVHPHADASGQPHGRPACASLDSGLQVIAPVAAQVEADFARPGLDLQVRDGRPGKIHVHLARARVDVHTLKREVAQVQRASPGSQIDLQV